MTRRQLTLAQARTVLLAAQGLPGRAGRGAAEVVRHQGFVRTLGGADAYLAVRARATDLIRERLDAAVADGEAAVIPAVRGCIYLVSRRHRAWALALADSLSRRRFDRDCEKAGIRPGELAEVGRAVEAALADGPLSPHGLRSALPDGTARSLGEAGKKIGLSSTLPPALRQLEFAGRVERAHEDGRLDSERYVWRLPAEDPFAGARQSTKTVSDDPTALHRDLAGLYFRWAGLGTADDFAAWSGLGKRDARQAAAALELVEVEVDGWEGPRLAFEQTLAAEEEVAGVALLPFEDNLVHLQGGPAALVDREHHGVEVPQWGRAKPTALGDARHMSFRSVVAGGRIVGFWEYDPDAEEVVLGLFDDPGDAAREELDQAADDVARFLCQEIGHGRSFSIDSDDDLRKRCGRLREMGG